MANTLNYVFNLQVQNAGYNFTFMEQNSPLLNGAGASGQVTSISTSATALATAGVTTLGYMIAKNLDPTNYCTLGTLTSAAYSPFIKLKAGETCIARLFPSVALAAQANTAATALSYQIFND